MIFIKGNVPSLKNSKVKTSRGIFPSKTVKKYLQFLGIVKYSVREKSVTGYKTRPNELEQFRSFFNKVSYPQKFYFHFVRNSNRAFDFHNAVQILADLFVAHDFIEDDDMRYFIPMPLMKDGKWYSVDKENPGVYITLQDE